MIDMRKDFNITKAYQLRNKYSAQRNLLKTCFVNELINYQRVFSPRSILYHELLIKKLYKKDLIVSVLNDFGYTLIEYKKADDSSSNEEAVKSSFKVTQDNTPKLFIIVFGPAEG